MAGPRQGAPGAPSRQHPAPSAWAARRFSPAGRSLLRPTRLRAELGAAEEKGASGRLGRPRVRYCSWSDSRSPWAGPRRACDCPPLPAPRPARPVPAAAPRRAGRRDAGVRADSGQPGLREERGCGATRGVPAAMHPNFCLGGSVPSLTHLPFTAGSGRFAFVV